MTWTTPAHGNPTAALWNSYVADNLSFLHDGLGFYLEGVVDDRSINLSGQQFNGWFVPAIARDLITVTKIAYRGNSASGHFDLGVFQDDGNGVTCSRVATSGITLVPAGSGGHSISLTTPAVLTPGQKYWLAVSWEAAGASISGTDGPAVFMTKQAKNVYPLPTVVTFSTQTPNPAPYLAALP